MRAFNILFLIVSLSIIGYFLFQALRTHLWASERMSQAERVGEKVKNGIWDDEVIAWNARQFGISEEEFRKMVPKKEQDGGDQDLQLQQPNAT